MIRNAFRRLVITSLLAVPMVTWGWAQPTQSTPQAEESQTPGTPPAVVAPAQPRLNWSVYDSNLPENTQLYLCAPAELPYAELMSAWERLSDNPVGDYFLQELVNELGDAPVSLLRDVLPNVRGNLVFALTRPGDVSVIESFRRHEEQAIPYEKLTRQVGFLGKEVAAFKNRFKRLPNSWEEMVEKKVRKTVPVSEHGQFTVAGDGSDWVVTVKYSDSGSPIARYAPAPEYRGRKGLLRTSPIAPPLHAILAFDTSNPQKVREALSAPSWSKLGLEVLGPNSWKLSCPHCTPWSVKIQGNQILMSDDLELLEALTVGTPASDAQNNKRLASLRNNPRYIAQYGKLHSLASSQGLIEDGFVFVDVKDIVDSTPSLKEAAPEIQPISSVGLVSRHSRWESSPSGGPPSKLFPKKAITESFLELNAPSQSPLIPANATTPATWEFVGGLPAQTSVTYAIHAGETVRLIDVVGSWYPFFHDLLTSGEKALQEELGDKLPLTDIKKGVGWTTSESEYLSQLINVGYAWIYKTRSGGNESKITELLSLLGSTTAIQLTDAQLGETLSQKFAALVPSVGNPTLAGPNKAWVNPDGLFAFAQLRDRILVSPRPTKQLMFRHLQVLAGKGPKISDEPYYGEFLGLIQGRPWMFFHEKVDGPYSLFKGLLLILDSDFRTDAEAVGAYRDAYVAATVENTGIHAYAAVYPSASFTSSGVESPASKDLLQLLDQLKRTFRSPLPKKKL